MNQKQSLHNRQFAASPRRQRGMSLIEVLVAMLVTTVGLLGFAGLQSRAMVSAEDTYVRTEAMALAQELLERKRINGATELFDGTATSDPAIATYTTASNWTGAIPTQSCAGASVTCTPVQMAQYDIAQMRNILASNAYIPQGDMLVTRNLTTGMINIYVAWGGETAAACAAAGGLSSGLARLKCIVLEGI